MCLNVNLKVCVSIFQPSLSVYPETVTQEGGVAEMLIKQESLEHVQWPGPAGSSNSADDLTCRGKRVGTSLGGE